MPCAGSKTRSICTTADSSSDDDIFEIRARSKSSSFNNHQPSSMVTSPPLNGYHSKKQKPPITDNNFRTTDDLLNDKYYGPYSTYCNSDHDINNVVITNSSENESFEQAPLYIAILVYLQYAVLVIFGYFRDFLRNIGIADDVNCPKEGRKLKVEELSDHR